LRRLSVNSGTYIHKKVITEKFIHAQSVPTEINKKIGRVGFTQLKSYEAKPSTVYCCFMSADIPSTVATHAITGL